MRDLNDEINQLFREKRAWENQIINLGGANYRRAAGVMTDDEGREVPGTRGYKWVALYRLDGRALTCFFSLSGILVEPKNSQASKSCLPVLRNKQLRNLHAPLHFKCSDIRDLIIMVMKTNWIRS